MMNVEMSELILSKITYSLRDYAGRGIVIIRAVLRRPAKHGTGKREAARQKASVTRERYNAEATAQVQAIKFLR
jgi:hypothetical protein